MNIKLSIAICVLSLVFSCCKNDDEIIEGRLGASYPLELKFDGITMKEKNTDPNRKVSEYTGTTSCNRIKFTISHYIGASTCTMISLNELFLTENGNRTRIEVNHLIPDDGIVSSGDWGNVFAWEENQMVYYTFSINENTTGADRLFYATLFHTTDRAWVYITQTCQE